MGKVSYKVTGRKLVSQQFRALLVKRFHHAKYITNKDNEKKSGFNGGF